MRRKKGCSCINLENGVDAWSRKTRAHASLFGCEAGGQPNRRQRRGARRRKNKGLREAEHHVPQTAGALSSEDVVLDDEGTRFCGRRSTTPPRRSPARRPAARKLQTTGAGTVPSPTAAGPRPAASGLAVRQQPQLPPGGSSKKDRRTVGPPNPSTSPTSPSGFSWSSSWIVASSGFWHVPARSGRSAAGPWRRTGSNNSCC